MPEPPTHLRMRAVLVIFTYTRSLRSDAMYRTSYKMKEYWLKNEGNVARVRSVAVWGIETTSPIEKEMTQGRTWCSALLFAAKHWRTAAAAVCPSCLLEGTCVKKKLFCHVKPKTQNET